jgi:bifunctional non-homologous end joining protein LigD
MGDNEFASIMWAKACSIDDGREHVVNMSVMYGPSSPGTHTYTTTPLPETLSQPVIKGLADSLQPGKIATSQAENLKEDLEWYVNNDRFWAQPKIDGIRLLAFAAPTPAYQNRTLATPLLPSDEIDTGLELLNAMKGMWILDGELYYEDADGGEHRTAAQADTVNGALDIPEPRTLVRYAIFDCLMAGGKDLTAQPFAERLKYAVEATEFLAISTGDGGFMTSESFRYVATVKSHTDKAVMVAQQLAGEREGVIFRDCSSSYIPGKSGTTYRHKFLSEFVLDVIELTETDAEGRPFGAIVTEMGRIGTGFTQEQMREIAAAFEAGPLRIEVTSQGLTEYGKLWHPRFNKIAEE